MPQGWGFGALGCPGGQFFFQTWSCGISNRQGWQAEQNASNIFILGSNWWPWDKVKRSNIINMSISKICIPNSLCVFSQIKDRKHIEQNFSSVARVMPRGGTCGCWGESKSLAWGFAMAPIRLRALVWYWNDLLFKAVILTEPVHEISNNVACATSKASDLPAHTRSMIRAFASRLSILWLLSYWLNIIWSF